MVRKRNLPYQRYHTYRRTLQILTLAFLFAVPLLNRLGHTWVLGTLYSLSFGNLTVVDPSLIIQVLLLTHRVGPVFLIGGLVPVVVALLLGKVFCSWACPFNFLAELGRTVFRRWRRAARAGNRNPPGARYWLIFAGILLVSASMGVPLITLFSMPGLLSAEVGDWVFAGMFGVEIFIVVLILALDILGTRRVWCKYVCPVGATLALFRTRRTLQIRYDAAACDCPATASPCGAVCPLQLDPRSPGLYPYCFNCAECVAVCQHFGRALRFSR